MTKKRISVNYSVSSSSGYIEVETDDLPDGWESMSREVLDDILLTDYEDWVYDNMQVSSWVVVEDDD